MDSLLLLTLTISLMFTGGQSYSMSESCSTVNGKTVCESQKSAGNVAGASSNARTGQGGSYQDANAMTGNTNTGQSSSSRTAVGNMPPGGMGPGFAPFAGGFSPSFGVNPTFSDSSNIPFGIRASGSENTGTASTFVTSGSDGIGAGGFAGPSSGFAGFGGSGGFAGGGIPPSFGVLPTFGDGSSVPFDTRASGSGNTGTASTFVTSVSDGKGAGGFAGPSSGFGGSSGFDGGGFSPSFGVNPTFRDSSNIPFGASGSENTGTASTFVTRGSDGIGAGGFAGPSSGLDGFGGSGGFAGGGLPPSFGVLPTFSDSSNIPFGTRASGFGNTGTASTFVTSGSDGIGTGGFTNGGFPNPFGILPTFGDGSSVPSGTSASNSRGNTGIVSTFATTGSDGSSARGFTGASSTGFGFGGGGVFVGGGAIPGIPGFGTGGGIVIGNPAAFDPFKFVFGRR